MNEKGGFTDWLKYRWKMIMVSDMRFFRFIWITAILITAIAVLISAGVVASSNKKKAAEKAKKKQEATTELELLATYTDATATDATVTDADSWELILINKDHPLPADFQLGEMTELMNNNSVDSRIYPDLQLMFDDARAEGYQPHVAKSYEAAADVGTSTEDKINELLDQGKTREQAEAEVAQMIPAAGTNEHETGLCIDLSSGDSDVPDEVTWSWFQENAHKYGFIVRYPENKVAITNVSDDPYHLRYVGVDAATEMYNSGQCLEEYLGYAQ